MRDCIEDIHDFWFGELTEAGLSAEDRNSLWFSLDQGVDQVVTERFGPWLTRARAGELEEWAETDRGLIALVVLLDQFSRNIYRGSANAFAADPRALSLATSAIAAHRYLQLPAIHRVFLYMPLEHAEDLSVQEHCVSLFKELVETTGDPQVESFARYAAAHRDVIEQFGRFPHRNAILGRESSAGELAHLETHGGF